MDETQRPWGTADWVTKAEVATYLGVSEATVGRWVREERLRSYKLAGTQSVRFKRGEVEQLLESDR